MKTSPGYNKFNALIRTLLPREFALSTLCNKQRMLICRNSTIITHCAKWATCTASILPFLIILSNCLALWLKYLSFISFRNLPPLLNWLLFVLFTCLSSLYLSSPLLYDSWKSAQIAPYKIFGIKSKLLIFLFAHSNVDWMLEETLHNKFTQ